MAQKNDKKHPIKHLKITKNTKMREIQKRAKNRPKNTNFAPPAKTPKNTPKTLNFSFPRYLTGPICSSQKSLKAPYLALKNHQKTPKNGQKSPKNTKNHKNRKNVKSVNFGGSPGGPPGARKKRRH